MSLREKMNQNPGIVTGAAVAAIVVCLVFIAYQFIGPSVELPPPPSDKAYFTIDEGKTFYEDADDKVPPYTKDGKQAYKAAVFRCGEGTPKAYWIERYPTSVHAELKKIHDAYKAAKSEPQKLMNARMDRDDAVQRIAVKSLEARLVNSTTWVRRYDPKVSQQFYPKCPDGNIADEVLP